MVKVGVVPPPPVTVTVQVAVLPPSAVVTIITAVPAFKAFTTPELLTVATVASLVLHDTFLFVALSGVIDAESASLLPTAILIAVLLSDTPVTAIVVGVGVGSSFVPEQPIIPASKRIDNEQLTIDNDSFLFSFLLNSFFMF